MNLAINENQRIKNKKSHPTLELLVNDIGCFPYGR